MNAFVQRIFGSLSSEAWFTLSLFALLIGLCIFFVFLWLRRWSRGEP